MVERMGPGCLHGTVVKRRAVANLILTETAHTAWSRLPRHAHENSYFCFVLQGIYTERYTRRELICKRATLTFLPAGEMHEDRLHSQDGRVFVLEIPPMWIDKLRENSLKLNETLLFRGGFLPNLFSRLNREIYKTDAASSLIIEGLAIEIMAEAGRQSLGATDRTTPRWLTQVRELLIEHFSESWTLERIAAVVGVHSVHLATVFRQKYGVTVGEFVRHLKIQHACSEIENGISLSTIALDAGFADQSHFSKTFKQRIGMTPTEYRRIANKP